MDPGHWPQALIEATDSEAAERVGVETLRPALAAAEESGAVIKWWFMRKAPGWRLRYLPADHEAVQHVAALLDCLAAEGRIVGWAPSIYEPETVAFGGEAGIEVAHNLFHLHSRETLDHVARVRQGRGNPTRLGRRELAILLPSVLMRGTGLDHFEQGDVWARVAGERTAGHRPPLADGVTSRLAWLMGVDMSPTSRLVDGGPLAHLAPWFGAFERAGGRLAGLARTGTIERGLRAVITHHVIFTWNILGLSTEEQRILPQLAKELIMGTDNSDPATAERLRSQLVDSLKAGGAIRTARVEAAVRAVPRHVFVRQSKPSATLDEAYADTAVYTKFDGSGTSISAVSQPTINAVMLELADARPGMRVMEAGAGSGLFAAYLGHIVGSDGHVTSYDLDTDLVGNARAAVAAANVENVTVTLGDGAAESDQSYDRVIATVGAYGIPSAWLDQLAEGGRLVVPLRLRGSVSRAIAFERDPGGRWRSVDSAMSTFMPLRGLAADTRQVVALRPDGSVTLQAHQDQAVDPDALADVLDQPRTETWTGVTFRGPETQEYLDLYLACAMGNAMSRMTMDRDAIASGLVKRRLADATLVTAEKGNLAYLTLRGPATTSPEGARLYEVGVVGHGPGGDELAARVAEAARTWDRDYRSRPVHFEILPAGAASTGPEPGRFMFDTPLNSLAIDWR